MVKMKPSSTGNSSFNRVLGVMYGLRLREKPKGDVLLGRVEKDLEKIRKMGFNIVYFHDIYRDPKLGATFGPTWYPRDAPSKMKPLSFDPNMQNDVETAFESAFKVALEKGLRIISSICYNVPLQWLWSNLDAAKRKSDSSLHYTVYYHECFRSEKFRQYTQGRLEQLLERYAENEYFHKALAKFRIEGDDAVLDDDGRPLFVIHNDTVDRGFCYCENCLGAWREEFLPRPYKDIDNFNAIHNTRYRSFNEVPLPKSRDDEMLWNDLSMFFTQSLMGWMQVIKSTIKRYMPQALFSIIMKYPRSGMAVEYPNWGKVNELCDVLFMDPYPMEGGTTWNIKGYTYDFETYRSISLTTGKPMLLQFQLTSSYAGISESRPIRIPTKDEILQQFYVAVGRGGKGLVAWGFPPRMAEADQPQETMKGEKAIKTVALLSEEAKKLFEISKGTKEVYGQIMLPYNYASLIMGDRSLPELYELYKHLSSLGLVANPTFGDFMFDLKKRSHRYDALIGFNSLRNTKKEHVESLVSWVKNGGAILCGAKSFLKDEKGEETTLKPFNREVIGSYATDEPAEGDLRIQETNPHLPPPATHPRPASSVSLAPAKGKVIAVWSESDTPAIVVNEPGRGMIERLGIEGPPNLDDTTTMELLEAFINSLPEGPIRVSGQSMGDIDFAFRIGKDLLIVFLVNNNRENRRVKIRVRPSKLGMEPDREYVISDVVSQQEIMRVKGAQGNGEISFDVEMHPLDSRALTVRPAS